jgi:flagellar assembly factor FliW
MNSAQCQNASDAEPMVSGIAVTPDQVVDFPHGLPGFETCHSFVLMSSPDIAPLQQLRAVSGPGASFIAVDPKRVLPNYRCDLSQFDRERLGATDDSVLLWLALIAIDKDGTTTVNLRAPVVINPATMTGYQVMPHRCLYALRQVITEIE